MNTFGLTDRSQDVLALLMLRIMYTFARRYEGLAAMTEGRKDKVLTIRIEELTYEALAEEADEAGYDGTATYVRDEILRPYTRGNLELGPTGTQVLLDMQDQMAQLVDRIEELEEEKDP